MVLEGTVSNVAQFGAFVDLGVHQDGLVHVSQLSNKFVNDARECNMGVVRGRWVFCDYGHTNLLRLGLQNFKWVALADTPLVRPAEIEINEWQLP